MNTRLYGLSLPVFMSTITIFKNVCRYDQTTLIKKNITKKTQTNKTKSKNYYEGSYTSYKKKLTLGGVYYF